MGKSGWLIFGLLVLALTVYAFRPEASPDAPVKVWQGTVPTTYTLTADGRDQTVNGDRVRLGTLDRARNEEKTNALWGAISGLTADPRKQLNGIGTAQTAAYGLDGRRQLTAEGPPQIALRWGVHNGTGYVWDGRSTFLSVVDPGQIARLDQAAGRLDAPALIDLSTPPDQITVDGLILGRQGSGWSAILTPDRPDFSERIDRLMSLIRQAELVTLTPDSSTFLLPVAGTVVLGTPGTTQTTLTLRGTWGADVVATNGVLEATGLPPQTLDQKAFAAWRATLGSFKTDPLISVARSVGGIDKITRVDATRDGTSEWHLDRRDKTGDAENFLWDLVWNGGRENAGDDTLAYIISTLDRLTVLEPKLDSKALTTPDPGALVLTLTYGRAREVLTVRLGNSYAASASHRGKLPDPAATREAFSPQHFLDDRLTRRSGERVAKIQRRILDQTTPAEEVVAKGDGGTWRRTWPTGPASPVDAGAIDRLIRVIAHARVQDLALVGLGAAPERAKALLAAPDLELAVRFAAVVKGRAANDETDLDETAPQDWGIALKKLDNRWFGSDLEGGLWFSLDDDTVEELRRPFADGQLFPVVAAVIRSVVITTGLNDPDKLETHLERSDGRWTVRAGDQAAKPAQEVEVRRWFRELGRLRVAKLDSRAAELTPLETVSTIAVEVPALGKGSETLTLALGRPGPQGVPVHVASNQATSSFPRGRALLDPAVAAGLLPSAASLKAP